MKYLSFMKSNGFCSISGASAGSKILLLSIAIFSLILSGCTTSPTNQSWVDFRDLDFSGYATEAGATIDIQAFDQSTNRWNTVATVTAATAPTHIGNQSLYAWRLNNFDFTTVQNYDCYWGYGGWCSIPAGFAEAKFRFKQNSQYRMITFDEGGISCVINRLFNGGNVVSAALDCASTESPVLTLRMLT